MLQRAARNAYSWWCASHIRTKQSKWLEQNLHDMEEKVEYIMKILDDDGDSFARRAEMYYRRRPELLNFVEDFFKSYKALAERFDYISKELQSANKTIATIDPERLQLHTEDEEDDDEHEHGETHPPPKPKKDLPVAPKLSIPEVVSIVQKKAKPSRMMSKKGLLKYDDDPAGASPTASGLSKDEALQEIDKLQKQMLSFQTEKEFVKSSYENALAKYWEIEKRVTEMQARVSRLQDEYGIGSFIDDDEARSLMASSALKSCRETLAQLQQKQQHTDEDAKVEHHKVRNAQMKFQSLVQIFESHQPDRQELQIQSTEEESPVNLNLEESIDLADRQKQQPDRQKQQIQSTEEESIDLDSSTSTHLTMSGLAEKIDELVDKIINLESVVVAQTAQVNRLRAEANELHDHLQKAEEEKETLLKDSEKMSNRIRELEEELQRVQNLNQTINNQSNYIYTRITEASCKVDDLSGKLLNVLPDEEVKDKKTDDSRILKQANKRDVHSSVSGDQESNDKLKKVATIATVCSTSAISADESAQEKQTKDGNTDHGIHEDPSTHVERGEAGAEDAEPNWRALYLNGLEDRDKLLLEEYLSVLRNYKESKRKLNESEKKRRAAHFQYVVQTKVLRNSVALKDAEIQALMKKLDSFLGDHSETLNSNDENTSKSEKPKLHRRTLSELLDVPITRGEGGKSEDVKMNSIDENQAISAIGEKIRTDIDELLDENIEFWLRFSTSFQQIRKFQSSVKDLQDELKKKTPNKQQLEKPLEQLSEIRPIYKHLREIQTELTLWLEHSAVLKDDLKNRLSSLCNIEEEITRFAQEGQENSKELSAYQAAKFQGEIFNMKHENEKVGNELEAGVKRVEDLQQEVRKTVQELDELGVKKETTNSQSRIPLRSFLFGVKLKKQKQRSSLFACVSPAMPKHYSELPAPK